MFVPLALACLAVAGDPEPTRRDLQGDPLPLGAVARHGSIRFRHGDFVLTVDFSADGKYLLSAGGGGVAVWDRADGRPIARLDALLSRHALFTADSRVVLTQEDPQIAGLVLVLWDFRRGETTVLRRGKEDPRGLALADDGKAVALIEGNTALVVLEFPSGKELATFRSGNDPLVSVRFLPRGRVVAIGAEAGKVVLWDAARKRRLRTYTLRNSNRLFDLAVRPDGKAIAVGLANDLLLFDVDSEEEVEGFDVDGGSWTRLRFSAAGALLHGVLGTTTYTAVDAATGKVVLQRNFECPEAEGLFVAPDGAMLVLVTAGGALHLLPPRGPEKVRPTTHPPWNHATLLADGRAACLDAGRTLHIWDTTTGQAVRRAPVKGFDGLSVRSLGIGGDGRFVAGCVSRGREETQCLSLVETDGASIVWQREGEVRQFGFRRDGRRLFVADNKSWEIRDTASGRVFRRGNAGGEVVALPTAGAATWSPDGRCVAVVVGGEKPSLRIWEAETGELRRALPLPEPPTAFAIVGTPRRIAVATAAEVAVFGADAAPLWRRRVTGRVTALAGSPEGRLLAAGTASGRVALWDVDSTRSWALLGHVGPVEALDFAAARRLLSASADGTALVWDLSALVGERPRVGE